MHMNFEGHFGATDRKSAGARDVSLTLRCLAWIVLLVSPLIGCTDLAKCKAMPSVSPGHLEDGGRDSRNVSKRLRGRATSVLRLGAVTAVVAISFFAQSASAYITIEQFGTPSLLQPSPETYNAEATLLIDSIVRNGGVTAFSNGQCLQLAFSQVPSHPSWAPLIPTAADAKKIETCNFDTTVECEVVDSKNFVLKLRIKQDTAALKGTIGKIKVPYSATASGVFAIGDIRFYSDCAATTPADQSLGSFPIISAAGSISTISLSVSKTVVGESSFENTATLKFKPGTSLRKDGGTIQITAPAWYNGYRSPIWPWAERGKFTCSSTQFEGTVSQDQSQSFNSKTR